MFFLILIKGKNILRMNKNSSRCLGETRIYWKEIRSTKTYLYIFTYESCLKLLKEDVFKVHQLVSCQLLISFLTFINFIFLAIIMYHVSWYERSRSSARGMAWLLVLLARFSMGVLSSTMSVSRDISSINVSRRMGE